jgi:hypothetical protein
MCRTIGGEEEGHCGISIIHVGIPHDRPCPPGGGAHGGVRYPWPEGGGGVLDSGLDAQLDVVAVAATLKSARLWDTLPMASRVLDLYEKPIT